jgi:dTDP-4-amino-4,6-dideoxygalactose transaminase
MTVLGIRGISMSRMIYPVKPYFPPEDVEEVKRIVETVLQSGMLSNHTYTRNFEKSFAELSNVKHAVAVNSGTAALEIALRTIGLKSGDEVLVPTNTFSATAAAVVFAGGKPVFTDIDPETLCINTENIQKYLTPRTKGVVAVHIGGLICPDIKAIKEICGNRGLFLVEDAAHAQGCTICGEPAGSFGDVACFSFYATKVMTTGEGGMITTNNDEVARKAEVLRDQGKDSDSGLIVDLGNNWRLPEVNAAMGIVQLKRLPEIIEKRNMIARYYYKELGKIDCIEVQKIPRNIVDNYYKYVTFIDQDINRDEVKMKLREKGVMCGDAVYWPPLHLQPVYRRLLKTKEGDFPKAEDVCKRMLCPPLNSWMSRDDAEYVISKIDETLSEI